MKKPIDPWSSNPFRRVEDALKAAGLPAPNKAEHDLREALHLIADGIEKLTKRVKAKKKVKAKK